jgi:pyruvate dehydrogenase (quinone)
MVSPDISQLPPHISFAEAHNLMSALMKGDPNEISVIKESIKSVLAGVLPHGDEHR